MILAWLRDIDLLLYEAMAGALLYPVTLWRAATRMDAMMDRPRIEEDRPVADRYDDVLGPAVFLVASVLVAHWVELALIGESDLVARSDGLAALVADDASLILLRLAAFAVFPLLSATRLVRASGLPVTRDALREPFYAQCYATAPFALAYSLGATALQAGGLAVEALGALVAASMTLWYLAVQARWFARRLGTTRRDGLAQATRAYLEALVALLALALLL